MSRTMITAVIAAAMLAAAMPVAVAQTATTPASPPGTAGTGAAGTTAATPTPRAAGPMGLSSPAGDQAANRVLPRQVRFEHLQGANVRDAQNGTVGTVEDIVLGRDGRIAAVVLEIGGFLGFGGKNVALSANELKMTRDDGGKPRFQVDMTKDQLKAAQAFDLTRKSTAAGTTTPPAGSSPVR